MKILITESLSHEGMAIIKKEKDIQVEERIGLSKGELLKIIPRYDALIVRSQTKVTGEVIECASRLKVIGRPGVGLDNVDVEAATKRGIIVMNTPEGNTISTAELTFGLLLSIARNIPSAVNSVKMRKWERGRFVGRELYNKTLGIIGLGRIGAEVARRALSFGMRILVYDPYVSLERAKKMEVQLVALKELLSRSDYITIHVPLTHDTHHLIGKREFKLMKKGASLINCARGGIVDENALDKALLNGKLNSCALDVFEEEPPLQSLLLDHERLISTPHLGASTEEAQANVATQIAQQVVDALKGRGVRNAANMPQVSLEVLQLLQPYIALAEKLGLLLSQLVRGPVQEVRLSYLGEMKSHGSGPITTGFLKGLLEPIMKEMVNYINAPVLAKERGIKVIEVKSEEPEDFANLIVAEVKTAKVNISASGTILGKNNPRIVRIDGYHVDLVPEGCILVCENHDRPGAIAHISKVLGERKVNIANMTVGRKKLGGKALTVLNVDESISPAVVAEIKRSKIIVRVQVINV